MTQTTDSAVQRDSADAGVATVRETIEIAAPPERVFRALTNPAELAAWWGSEETYRARDWKIDAREGGRWSATTTDAAGNEGALAGVYSVVDPARALELTWFASWDESSPSSVRYDLAPAQVDDVAGTRLTVTHSHANCARADAARSFDLSGVITCLARHARHAIRDGNISRATTADVTPYVVFRMRHRTMRPRQLASLSR